VTPVNDSLEQMRKLLSVYRDQAMEDAHTLPAEFYRSMAFFEFERNELLRREWLCVGRADEIPEPGDFFTTDLLDEPLLIVRGDDGLVRVLVNICRHRGMLVANGAGHTRHFVCPYHAWTYGRDGHLLRSPHIEKSHHFDPDRCRLPQLASEIWNGFVFVNFDGRATALAPRLKGLDALLANYETAGMHHAFVEEEEWRTNWKCLVENFMEGYHLSVLHKDTLHAITPTALCEKFPGGPGYTGYKAYYTDAVPADLPCSPKLDARERRCSTLFCVYPTLVVSQAPERLRYMALHPTSANTVKFRRGTATYETGLDDQEITKRVAVWNQISNEDRRNLERLQRGYISRHTANGPLAPANYEGTIFDFYRYLAGRLSASAELRVA
jgi:phenylpropionate dioxygenase-like ring-hydroxylating dioxygenase large terminal subunit